MRLKDKNERTKHWVRVRKDCPVHGVEGATGKFTCRIHINLPKYVEPEHRAQRYCRMDQCPIWHMLERWEE